MTITEAVKEAIWLQELLEEHYISQRSVTIHCDSMSAIYLAKNQVFHARTKHIDVRYHFVRDVLEDGDVEIVKVHTKDNPVDMLTKVVPSNKFDHCRNLLHIRDC